MLTKINTEEYREIPLSSIDWKLYHDDEDTYFYLKDMMTGGFIVIDIEDIDVLDEAINIIKKRIN